MMIGKKGLWLVILLVSGAAIAGTSQLVFGREEQLIPQEEMKKTVESRYAGTVESITLQKEAGREVYSSVLKMKNGRYQISTDAVLGSVVHIAPLQGNSNSQSQLPKQEEQAANTFTQVPVNAGISLDRAKAIALEQVAGLFDGIEVEVVNGTQVYEVEIDTHPDREAKIQVDAYTGKVLSIMWED